MSLAEFAELTQSASIIVAALVAIYGFDAWRREHVGKRRIELAEDVLVVFYQARDAIADIRSPVGFGGEGSTRNVGEHERPEDKEALDAAYVLIERYRRHSELFARIQALRYRVMVQFGTSAAEPFDTLSQVVNKLLVSAHQMARMTARSFWDRIPPEEEERRHEQLLDVYKTYYGMGGGDDPIAPLVESAVIKVEETCRAVIESQGTLYALINVRLGRR